ncbi:unnamed protein product [Echinostoma caproni]|uniref:Uncharacterized protein n=1 Tax=Echinostoma caproni TaxID=27848 RepID=A0A183AKK9_9TREM|nr:unnamed protein product [Echinostoma caproni]
MGIALDHLSFQGSSCSRSFAVIPFQICKEQNRPVTTLSAPVISPTTPTPVQRNSVQALNPGESLRMAQKRPNPSSSIESSPDTTLNGSCAPHSTSEEALSTNSVHADPAIAGQRTREHSLTISQAPIRLCLDSTENGTNQGTNIYSRTCNNNNSNGIISPPSKPLPQHSAPLPVYPCYREAQNYRSINPVSLTSSESESESARVSSVNLTLQFTLNHLVVFQGRVFVVFEWYSLHSLAGFGVSYQRW